MSGQTEGNVRLHFMIVLLMVLAVSCGPGSRIVGRWQQVGGDQILEFFDGGTVTATSFGITITGDYEFLDKDTIRLDMRGLFGLGNSQVLDIRISGDTLILSASGVSVQYNRLR